MSDEIKPATCQDQPPNSTGYPFPQKPPPVPATKRPTEDRKTAELRAAMSYALGEEPTA
jgi:hypothetical protein